MLKIGILGRHPQLESSFNGVMSFYEAMAFSELGCAVTLMLPRSDIFQPRRLLEKAGFERFSQLDLGDRIEIMELMSETNAVPEFDALIWQSYRQEDEPYRLLLQPHTRMTTKNFPRFFVRDADTDARFAKRVSRRFDLFAFALEEDFNNAREHGFFGLPESAFTWAGRGCSPEWLNPGLKTQKPSIGFDRAIKPTDGGVGAVAHIKAVIEQLRRRIPELDIYQIGSEPLFSDSRIIGYQPMRRFYDSFLNPIWLYLSIDFAHSVHSKNLRTQPDGFRIYKGLFENQFMEAQMSGAILAACAGETPPELFAPAPARVAYSSHAAIDEICQDVERAIDDFPRLSTQAREYAIGRYHYRLMGERWLAAIERRLTDLP